MLLVFLISAVAAEGQFSKRFFPVQLNTNLYTLGTCSPIEKTADGGYLFSYSYGNAGTHQGIFESLLIKTDSSFVPVWRKNPSVEGKRVFSFPDGTSIGYSGAWGLILEKQDNQGQTFWTKRYAHSGFDMYVSDGTYHNGILKFTCAVGSSFAFDLQASILRVDPYGNVLGAEALYQGASHEPNTSFHEITCDSLSGNCYVFGSVRLDGTSERWSTVGQIDSTNQFAWHKIFVSAYDLPRFTTSTILANGDLLAGGTQYRSAAGIEAMILIRFSPTGDPIWAKTIPYTSKVDHVQELPGGSILVTGALRAIANHPDSNKNIVLKLDPAGNVIWFKEYGHGIGLSPAYIEGPNRYYLTAFTNSPTILAIDSSGGISGCYSADVNISLDTIQFTATYTNNPTLYPIATTTFTHGSYQTSNQSYVDSCTFTPTSVRSLASKDHFSVYPNPTSGVVNINFASDIAVKSPKVSVISMTGMEVMTKNMTGSSNRFSETLDLKQPG